MKITDTIGNVLDVRKVAEEIQRDIHARHERFKANNKDLQYQATANAYFMEMFARLINENDMLREEIKKMKLPTP